ncbi:UNVERIFIED_CONTAM: hypothetical protein PYX00_005360 [Menopon gallinae]|uniref:ABC transporter domain-containing protein n=1 Tax=Menopon gallinae TaxID=328185 RepID=A0AAW2HSL6_9NEOP
MSEGADNSEGITITWRNLTVYASTQERKFFSRGKYVHKRIINNATGAVRAGNLVALMGPSGSGKSTLMSALANRSPHNVHIDGDIRVNGIPIGNFLNKMSGYMYQEDLFVGALTVREHLRFMAWMKLGRNKKSSEIEKMVKDLLVKVELTDSADKRIGINGHETVLSGGEKKKLAFATEMITDPKLFFCDEPTTGLDSYSAQSIVHLMKLMASQNKTVLCTIHQPSSEIFDMFSNLILLFEGRIAFIGDSKDALKHFEKYGYYCPKNYNPAEFFIKTLTTDIHNRDINRFCDEFVVSKHARDIDSFIDGVDVREPELIKKRTKSLFAADSWNGPAWTTKLYWLTRRSFLQVVRDPSVQAVRILQKLGIAFMAGLCFAKSDGLTQAGIQAVQGAIFLFVTENTFPGMYAVLSLFPQELPLFLREYRNGFYPSHLFYISKMTSLLPGLILDPFLFVVVFYWLARMRTTFYSFSMTALTAILTMNVATACGSFFSNAFESISVAMACLVPFDYMLMVTSGVFIKLSTLPRLIDWFQYFSWFMYANEVIMIVQWEGVKNISCEYTDPEIACLNDGLEVLQKFEFSPSHTYRNILAMIIMYILFHLFSCLFLWRKAKINK